MQSSQQPISSKQDSGDYQSIFNANHWQISPLPEVEKKSIQTKIDGKLKPLGSLGALEALAFQLACIQQTPKLTLDYPALLVFAADHGIANQAISIGPPSVTGQMVTHFLQGDAAINCFCRANNLPLSVIDAGMLPTRLPPHTSTADLNDPPSRLDPQFISQPVAQGSRDLSIESAMSAEQAARSLQLGAKVARQQIQQGSHVLAFGEMGIGNTAVAAAVLACLTSWPVNDCVGRGTGITDEQLVRKKAAIATGVERCRQSLQTSTHPPMTILTEVGGFDIGQIHQLQ